LKPQTETGDFLALPNEPPGNGHKITDWDKFRENALTNGDKTQVEIALLWDGEISSRTISRALKKIGFTRKKKTYGIPRTDRGCLTPCIRRSLGGCYTTKTVFLAMTALTAADPGKLLYLQSLWAYRRFIAVNF